MIPDVINLAEKLSLFEEQWSPRIIGEMNGHHLKLAKLQGEFVWHSHAETDEVFIVLRGSLRIEFRDGTRTINENEMIIIPAGVEHRPVAEDECHVLLIERAGTINTGDVRSDRSATAGEWI